MSNFSRMAELVGGLSPDGVDGILMDLGVSSHQLDCAERGFSLRVDGPLDMRMDPSETLTAARIVNTWEEADLAVLFRELDEAIRNFTFRDNGNLRWERYRKSKNCFCIIQ